MRATGTVLLVIGIVLGITSQFAGPSPVWLVFVAFPIALLGGILYILDSLKRLSRGQVVLRPYDALKYAFWMFVVMCGLRLLIWLFFPDFQKKIAEGILFNATFALAFAFSTTAYRKSA